MSTPPARASNNFDFVRLFAASLVVVQHSFDLLGYYDAEPLRHATHGNLSLGTLGVYLFFVMSGYLITQSMFQSRDYKTYFAKRTLRIFPALILDILIAVLLFGTLSTTLPLREYFSDPLTLQYLANISLYHLSYNLPGVFADHHYTAVNGSMWTLCYEFTCYLLVALLFAAGLLKRRALYLCAYAGLLAAWVLWLQKLPSLSSPSLSLNSTHLIILSLYFGAGALYYLYRDRVRYHSALACALFIILALSLFTGRGLGVVPFVAIPYILLTFVLKPIRGISRVGRFGDFSYGTYIYSFPLQQMIIQFTAPRSVAWMMLLSFALTIPFAALSWFVVERPALRLKDRMFKRPVAFVVNQDAALHANATAD